MSNLTYGTRKRFLRPHAVLALAAAPLALTAAAITGSAAQASASTSPTLARSCAWPLVDSATAGNVFAPDSSATYWIQPFTVQSGLRIVVQGRFPDARYTSFTVYKGKGGDFTLNGVNSWLTDYQIAPDPGSANPWQQPAKPGGHYTLALTSDVSPGQANTLPLAPAGTANGTTGFLVYRVYLPRGGDFSAAPRPALTFEEPSGSKTLHPCADPSPATPSALPTSGSAPTGPELQFLRHEPSNAGFPNADSGNLMATVTPPGPGDVVVVSAKAPTYSPGNRPSVWPSATADVRYWSMCNYLDQAGKPLVVNRLPGGAIDEGCRADEDTALGANGDYTYVVGTEAQQGEIEKVPGVTFLPLSSAHPATTQVLLLRNMLASSSFAQAIQNVPQDGNPASAQAVMGPYYPRAAVCSLVTLTTLGPQACLSGS
jgi:hypothetical protein